MPGTSKVAQARWECLLVVQHLCLHSKSLPSVDAAEQGCYALHDISLESLKNDITILRSDLQLNIFKQRDYHPAQLTDQEDIRKLEVACDLLLAVFEGLVNGQILTDNTTGNVSAEILMPEDDHLNRHFPKLIRLRRLSQPKSIPDNEQPTDGQSFVVTMHTQFTEYIHFPPDAFGIQSCRQAVTRFGALVDEFFIDAGSWSIEAHTQYYNDAEVEIIHNASKFASASRSLFVQMADVAGCGTPHQAKLQLSGFRQNKMQLKVSTCQATSWISASFTRSFTSSMPACNLGYICAQTATQGTESQIPHRAPNPSTEWEQMTEDDSEPESSISSVLDDVLNERHTLSNMHRKLLGVLLACSLLQLYDTPWIQQQWRRDTLYLPPGRPCEEQLPHWHPQVNCTLSPRASRGIHGDDIAAFGILLMELEANDEAIWSDEDVDWLLQTKSNHSRLARILRVWKNDVREGYRKIGKACLDFENLVSGINDPMIPRDMSCLAVIYKSILDPLFRYLVDDFGDTRKLFRGIAGPWGNLSATVGLSSSHASKRALFDDFETTEDDKKTQAAVFKRDHAPFFKKILDLRNTIPSLSLTQSGSPKRIKIAVLDSGVDRNDPKIKNAQRYGRIKGGSSWVGSSYDQDNYGHGTHVARFLLETAPAAELYIAKICDNKFINGEFMPGIVKALEWATDNCKVDIISMSLGWEDGCSSADNAVDRALEQGVLVFAAASNNGGKSGRSRPARNEDVMCIHACDGLGNKGDFSPSPLEGAKNFTTLGVAVPSRWRGKDVWKSGTSFATPIATGFAADVLEFANFKCDLTPDRRKVLRKRRGMNAIFKKMSSPEKRDGYDFVYPIRLWNGGRSDEDVAKDIEKAIQAL